MPVLYISFGKAVAHSLTAYMPFLVRDDVPGGFIGGREPTIQMQYVPVVGSDVEAVINQRPTRPTSGAPDVTFHQTSSRDWRESIGRNRNE